MENSGEGVPFDPKYDLDGDGEVNSTDWDEFQKVADGLPVETLEGKKYQSQVAKDAFAEKVELARLKGTIDGDTTTEELQRLYDNETRTTEIFGGTPPSAFTKSDLQENFPYDAVRGDPEFRKDLDFNQDGTNDFADFVLGAQQISQADSGVEGSRTKVGAGGMYIYQPPGPQTLAARGLGVNEDQLVEAARQFDENLGNTISEFKSSFGGYLVDDDGKSLQIYNQKEKKWEQGTRAEREQFDLQLEHLETLMTEGGMEKFANSMGLEWDKTNKLKREEQLALVQGVMSIIFNPVTPTPLAGRNLLGTVVQSVGQVAAAFAPAAAAASDAVLKRDIYSVGSYWNDFKKLTFKAFNWKTDRPGEGPTIGLIAQDVENVFPEHVSFIEKGVRGVDYGTISGVINSIVLQEAMERIERLESRSLWTRIKRWIGRSS